MKRNCECREDLFYVCSLIEFTGRKTCNRRGVILSKLSDEQLRHHLEYADLNHSLPFDRVCDELCSANDIEKGDFDTITGCPYSIPTVTAIGKVYSRLIADADSGAGVLSDMRKVFGSFIVDEISDFRNGVYCENPSYLLESFKSGRLLPW